jgi:hypothetical protein
MAQLGTTMNGTLKWILVALWGVTMAIGGIVWELTRGHIEANERIALVAQSEAKENKEIIDSLSYHVREVQLEQRIQNKEQNIQLAEIAKSVGARVTIDSGNVVVDTVIIRDST